MATPSAWLGWALLSALFAAATAIFAKLGLQGVDSDFATLVRTAAILLVLGAFVAAAPTLMASWYGMNFHHMPELDQPWAYPAMITATGAICVVLYGLLKRAGWL